MSYSGPSAVNPIIESPYVPSSESTHSGHSSSPDHPGERIGDSSMPMQYVNHANMNTTGYAYAEHSRLHGISDVDVDEKPHLVYESMAEVQHQARQRMMNGGNLTTVNVETGDQFAGIPNDKANRSNCNSATYTTVKVIWNIFLFIVAVGAFSLSVYNFLNDSQVTVVVNEDNNNMVTEPPSQSQFTGNGISNIQFEELNNTVSDLKAMLSQLSATHESRYSALNSTIFTAIESVQSVSASNELDLSFGCVDTSSECLLIQDSTAPFISCETSEEPLEVDGFSNVNVYCSVDNTVQEANPVVASLNIYGGQISCLCNVLNYATSTRTPTCRLNIRRCPKTIRLNTTGMP